MNQMGHQDRYPALSEFLQNLQHSNPRRLPSEHPRLMERVSTEN